MQKITVLGSLNMDLVTRVNHTPRVGETVHGDGLEQIPGGKGANQAVALAKLTAKVTMIGRVGEDAYGETLNTALVEAGVDTAYVASGHNTTGMAMIMVNEGGDNSIVVIPGANFDLKPDHMQGAMLTGSDYLLAQLETPLETIQEAFELARDQDIYTVLNPAPAQELPEALLNLTDLLIPNETEFEKITGTEDIDVGMARLFAKGVKEVILTLGEKGVHYRDHTGRTIDVAAHVVKAVDTTAAGDSFIAGYLAARASGKAIEEALDHGTKVAAITVTRFGAQSSLPTAEEVENFKEEVIRT